MRALQSVSLTRVAGTSGHPFSAEDPESFGRRLLGGREEDGEEKGGNSHEKGRARNRLVPQLSNTASRLIRTPNSSENGLPGMPNQSTRPLNV